MNGTSTPFVSVIIPVFDNPRRLKTCLRALEEQGYPRCSYEVIVVDNGSSESIEPIVASFGQAVAVHEERPGSYAARNRGLSLARGEVIAFTDSDCIARPDWIERGVANLLGGTNRGLVAGKVETFFEDPRRPTSVELYEGLYAFDQKRYVETWNFGTTANLFAFRSVFDKVGLFDPMLRSGGDYEWGRRVFSSGYCQVYADDTRVAHPARYSLGELYGKTIRVAGGIQELRRKDAYLLGFDRAFFVQLVPPVRSTLRILSDKRLGRTGDRVKVMLIALFVQYATIWGRLRARLGAEPRR